MDDVSFRTGIMPDGKPVNHGGYRENQKTIAKWADATFGPAPSLARVAARANEEMAELLQAVAPMGGVFAALAAVNLEVAGALRAASLDVAPADEEQKADASLEAADVTIVLMRFCELAGHDLLKLVDGKMVMNRTRQWRRDGTGHGYHTRNKED